MTARARDSNKDQGKQMVGSNPQNSYKNSLFTTNENLIQQINCEEVLFKKYFTTKVIILQVKIVNNIPLRLNFGLGFTKIFGFSNRKWK